jgi:hypothetical protein
VIGWDRLVVDLGQINRHLPPGDQPALEVIMAIEMLSYSQLGERLNCSPEAARALVRRAVLPGDG